jgi:hypothetical protein
MPVVLRPRAWDQWLDPGNEDIKALLKLLVAVPAGEFEAYPISTRVNNIRNEGPPLARRTRPYDLVCQAHAQLLGDPMASSYATLPQPLPLYVAAREPVVRNRWTAAIRIIMVIPQAVVLFFVGVAALVVAVIGWFGALFTGRLPDFAEQFLSGVLRWSTRVTAYFYFLTDDYPPFSLEVEEQYPVQIAIPPEGELNRLAVLFRLVIAIPAGIVVNVVGPGLSLFSIASWATIVFTGAMPRPLYEATEAVIRYETRLYGYLSMLTAEYPWGLYGDNNTVRPTSPPPSVGPTGPWGTVGEGVDSPPAPAPESVVSSGWLLRLSPKGRTALTVLVVLGVVWTIYTDAVRY